MRYLGIVGDQIEFRLAMLPHSGLPPSIRDRASADTLDHRVAVRPLASVCSKSWVSVLPQSNDTGGCRRSHGRHATLPMRPSDTTARWPAQTPPALLRALL